MGQHQHLDPGRLRHPSGVDADPVADIRNSRRIRAVMQGGRMVDRPAILDDFGPSRHPRGP